MHIIVKQFMYTVHDLLFKTLYVTVILLNDEYVNFIYWNCEMKKYNSNSEGKWIVWVCGEFELLG